jgi:hypothetical protein
VGPRADGRLPDFLVIGAMKAGTTSLFNYLREHPEIFMPAVKEVHFFSEQNWWRGIDWYRDLFRDAGSVKAIGEASPGYSRYPVSPDVPERVAAVLPDAKLVYVLRHPVDRLVSQYHHQVVFRGERRPIDEAVLDHRVYLATSRYGMQIQRYLEHFPRDRLLVVLSEQLFADRAAALARVFTFLGVDPTPAPTNLGVEFNRAGDLRSPTPVGRRLRGSRAAGLGRRVLPPAARQLAWRLASRRPPSTAAPAALRPETRAAIVDALRPDLRWLRAHLGPSFRAWGLLDDE